MKKNIISIFSLLLILAAFVGCSNDDTPLWEGTSGDMVLQLPQEMNVDICTRGVNENAVNDMLAVVIRDGVAKYQSFTSPVINNGTITLKLNLLVPQVGEKIYIFCNTGEASTSAANEDELLKKITCDNNQSSLRMYGNATITDVNAIRIELSRVLAKVELGISNTLIGYDIESWQIRNAPSKSFVGEVSGYPDNVTFDTSITPQGGIGYFIPRTDNSTADLLQKTCILLKITNHGWYRLDFYKNSSFLDIARNTLYKFTITAVNSEGYDTEDEAIANLGSNIEYEIENTDNSGVSNGQYLLKTTKAEIELYPVGGGTYTIDAINVSAVIPNADTDIKTYTVTLVTSGDQVQLASSEAVNNTLDLYKNVKLTSDNSLRTIQLLFKGADVEGSYLEFQLGNLKQRVPIHILSSNCYLADFSTKIGNTIYIPLVQANKDGKTRISHDDISQVKIEFLWSDQAGINDKLKIGNNTLDKFYFTLTNEQVFTGNAVIVASVNGVTRWSWHIWALDNAVIEFNSTFGIYDFKSSNTHDFNTFTWMDRNLGALNINTPSDQYTKGMVYQWGRKDPFPGDGTIAQEEPTVYGGDGTTFQMGGNHPIHGKILAPTAVDRMEYSIENPTHFMLTETGSNYKFPAPSTASEYDWLSTSMDNRNNNLWSTIEHHKNIYDPCPTGWRTPDGGEAGPWVGLWPVGYAGVSGLTWPNAGYYPFASFRSAATGVLVMNTISTSHWWGNGKQNSLSNCTTMSANKVEAFSTLTRAAGLYVRCVRE